MHPDPAFRWPKSANDHQDADERAALDATGRRAIAHLMREFGET